MCSFVWTFCQVPLFPSSVSFCPPFLHLSFCFLREGTSVVAVPRISFVGWMQSPPSSPRHMYVCCLRDSASVSSPASSFCVFFAHPFRFITNIRAVKAERSHLNDSLPYIAIDAYSFQDPEGRRSERRFPRHHALTLSAWNNLRPHFACVFVTHQRR